MTWFTEDPWPMLCVWLVVALLFAVAFVQSGRVVFLGGVVLAAFGGAVGWIVERAIVTEQETVEIALYEAADLLVAGEPSAMSNVISPKSKDLLIQVQTAMRQFDVQSYKIGSPKITVNPLTSPPTATVHFIGRIDGTMRDGKSSQPFAGPVTVVFERLGERWRIQSADLGR